jgi:rhodanese-related sulfurtransferase
VTQAQAQQQVAAGKAVLVDVRFPSEFKFDAIDGAVNLPLNQIRHLMADLDKTKQYISYCQTGRRSSAAAFILIEQGFDAVVLEADK